MTTAVKISPYIAFLASGSGISDPKLSGRDEYDLDLRVEMARIGSRGGTVNLTHEGLLDLAEWLDAIGSAQAQDGNTSGARSCERLAELARSKVER